MDGLDPGVCLLKFRGGFGARGAVAPKYRNPENPAETWAGRGLKPRWLAAAVKSGKKPEDFPIAGPATIAVTKPSSMDRLMAAAPVRPCDQRCRSKFVRFSSSAQIRKSEPICKSSVSVGTLAPSRPMKRGWCASR
jgi:H-NS histone family